ncbi:uncharacterized protein LOC142616645 [Castanea sativa]|uniref:uncharacterized protein LOC142616645 n=1 Tax=Castanea sativa TaxID=21020 RepID=UPI003F64EF7B
MSSEALSGKSYVRERAGYKEVFPSGQADQDISSEEREPLASFSSNVEDEGQDEDRVRRLTMEEFFHCYRPSEITKSKGMYSFVPRSLVFRLVFETPDSNRNWKGRYFFLHGDDWMCRPDDNEYMPVDKTWGIMPPSDHQVVGEDLDKARHLGHPASQGSGVMKLPLNLGIGRGKGLMVVEEAWFEDRFLPIVISKFTTKFKKWNSEVFGNLFARKRRVLARMGGVQKAIACHPSEGLLKLEKALIEEHALIMLQEEEFWALKSRLNATTFRDCNTSYFHIITMSLVINFSCCMLSKEEKNRMGREVVDEEIKAALWSLKAFKVPCPDGLHAGFFQHFWHDVQASVCHEVKKAFTFGTIPDYLNTTLITLIPKCNNPESLANFRPISLCNSVYKVISKVLVARIWPLLNSLISPIQIAFVPGRRGVDNVVIAQELLYTMDRKKGKDGFMAIKVDLEKSYDWLEWSFIHKVLQAFRLPHNIIKLIMSCIWTSSLSMLLNGCALDSFNPSRGIRQGDPLSPYLFILCMEYLGLLIEGNVSNGSWSPIKASRGNIRIFHLFFADNLILFAKVTKEIGEKINCAKSRIYFSPNVRAELTERNCDKLGMFETKNFRKYLGFPLKHKGAPRRQFDFVANRVMKKLVGWKTKFLSFAGRVVLKFTKDGDFSTNSVYLSNKADTGVENTFKSAWIWKLDSIPKIKNIFWLCMHNSAPVRGVLASRATVCITVAYLGVLFFLSLFGIYGNINRVVFDNIPINMNLHEHCLSQAREFFFCVGKMREVIHSVSIQVKWTKPPEGWYKLNTDGASCGNPGKAGDWGLIRNCSGFWVKGFARSIGFASSITSECWALRDGLMVALSEGIQNPIVELDARVVVVDLVSSNVDSNKPYSPLLCDCRCLLRRFPRVQVKHVYREDNRCADALARWGFIMVEDFDVFSFPPSTDILYLVN